MTKQKILIATGGTGGHIFPACSLANYLIVKNFNVQITTDKRGAKYLEAQNFNLKQLPSSPLKKLMLSINPKIFTPVLSNICIPLLTSRRAKS